MAFTELRRTLIPNNTGIGAPFTAVTDWYDPATRRPFSTEEDSQVNDPRQLATDKEVDRFEVKPGLVHVVRYNGHGSIYTTSITTATGPGNPSTNLQVAGNNSSNTSAAGLADAYLDVTGQGGVPPYQLLLTGTSGPAAGNTHVGLSPSGYYPYRFRNLLAGGYDVQVTDASGAIATKAVTIYAGVGVPAGYDLHVTYRGDQDTGSGTRKIWVYNDATTYEYQTGPGSGNDGDDYYTADGFLVDAYLLDPTTWRQVLANGQGDVYYVDSPLNTAAAGTLELHNLIWLDPDTAAEQNGGILMEVNATALPVTFSLPGQPSNTTGSFDSLGPGAYPVTATDKLGNTVTVTVELKLRYGKRYELTYQEVGSATLFRIELWTQDYAGQPETIIGGAEVAVLESDALNTSLGGQGDLPPVVGTSLEATFRVPGGTFDEIDAGPKFFCRVDFYHNNKLEFRGFVIPSGLSESELQDGKLETSLTATDGLAQLKDVRFTGHQGQRLLGHRPWLNTIVHCLSRCKIALPLRFFTNRRDATMADTDAPETQATSNRTGYWKEGDDATDPLFQRDTLNALAQALGGTLCQRGGAWEVRSPLEAAQDAPGRIYKPAGTYVGAATAPAPAGAVRPPRAGGWHWVERNQRKQVRSAWSSLTGRTDVGYLKNAYIPGKVFSDPYAWVTDASKLRAITGWQAPAGKTFPLVFVRTGDKQDKHATRWLRSANISVADDNYITGPLLPLVAGGEAVPAFISFTGRLVSTETYSNPVTGSVYDSPTTAPKALLPWAMVVDGLGVYGGVAELKAGSSDVTFTAELPALVAGAGGAVLQVGAWYAPDTLVLSLARTFTFGDGYKQGEAVKHQGKFYVARQEMRALGNGIGMAPGVPATAVYWAEITATDHATGQLLLSEVGVQLRPQNVMWDGEDNVRVDSDAGTVRATEVLDVFHADVPPAAGLYSGNLYAFGRGTGLLDGTMTTNWKRPSDLAPAPLFESAVLDIMALREGPSKLVMGTLRTAGLEPPRLLDSIDTPSDLPGRRFLVGTRRWATKRGKVEVSLLEIGPGEGAVPAIPAGARATTNVVQWLAGLYLPELRATEDGYIRVVE